MQFAAMMDFISLPQIERDAFWPNNRKRLLKVIANARFLRSQPRLEDGICQHMASAQLKIIPERWNGIEASPSLRNPLDSADRRALACAMFKKASNRG